MGDDGFYEPRTALAGRVREGGEVVREDTPAQNGGRKRWSTSTWLVAKEVEAARGNSNTRSDFLVGCRVAQNQENGRGGAHMRNNQADRGDCEQAKPELKALGRETVRARRHARAEKGPYLGGAEETIRRRTLVGFTLEACGRLVANAARPAPAPKQE